MSRDLLTPALALLLALALWLIYQNIRKAQTAQRRAQTQLTLHWHSWLMQQWGLPFEGAQPQHSSIGAIRGYRILREQLLFVPAQHKPPHSGPHLKVEAIVTDEQQAYWLVFFGNHYQRARGAQPERVELLQEPQRLRISELRARRALFNDPAAYGRAFGEAPNRQRLAAWRKLHPEQEPQTSRF